MDYTPTQYHHHHHNQELERMMSRISSSSSSNANPSSATRIEILDDGDEGGGDGGGNGNKAAPVIIEREHMFDKVVTPSDVGKLNRLVIPKQHAEKYFPLDSSTNEKGLLLNFEDRTGKPWRFRYSYWNSSQSYVITKGWSRFVKEKKLDAGNIVSFQRGVGDVGKNKLFIDWRRRPDSSGLLSYEHYPNSHARTFPGVTWVRGTNTPSPPFVLRSHPHLDPNPNPNPNLHHRMYPGCMRMDLGSGGGYGIGYGFGYGNVVNPYPVTGSLIFLRPSTTPTYTSVVQNGGRSSSKEDQNQRGLSLSPLMQREEVYESVPVVQGKATAKRLRLFGVNMDCPISNQTHRFDILSSSSTDNNHHAHHHQQHVAVSPTSQSYSHHQLNTSSFYNGSSSSIPLEKGKSSTSSSMSLDLDI